ncbi:predicted protein [Aspergillus nidulans FGSC A4]|uniref:Uncharacterized protein n=1 Tax=Emericella nidulans (strain FGSC A4 / ATCC 38163 / CBS 112.46 / NRRL 194 / M139) TaxID=227321 RepID=Q5ASJ6_EMENI|nr:hypothetical protein [Aspergillus nidulans FGSC A4]EAA60283.1 predicted protein [Aspergillus nidulans FGSC A4]CBF78138.1 TPA: conserved hypothetical protein [Aspergillus nidulans FGSC A4]|eukprot:XP_682003.1 predicted protein [Aspergillus nidulans FGSC A4]
MATFAASSLEACSSEIAETFIVPLAKPKSYWRFWPTLFIQSDVQCTEQAVRMMIDAHSPDPTVSPVSRFSWVTFSALTLISSRIWSLFVSMNQSARHAVKLASVTDQYYR